MDRQPPLSPNNTLTHRGHGAAADSHVQDTRARSRAEDMSKSSEDRMETPCLTRTYRSHHLDSERWDHVALRPGDVVISTSMKAGTTWMQRIMSLLVFGPGPLPAPLVALSPWIDAAFLDDVEAVVTAIEAQEHQR